MIRRLILIAALVGLVACAAPEQTQDGGIGGTGAPAAHVTQV